ncbi:MAG: tRNA dihydrouridine synthase DusB [Bdellovibrionales bacterium]|nr:tRNA dihydrouridine synthase DusB [Bdellovibrionales bacterium]
MKEQELIDHIQKNPFVLAPMAGITDASFRSFMREMGCGVVVTELVSATGLKYSSEKTRKLMRFSSDQHPVGIQLFGDNIEHLVEAAQIVEDMGADFVDMNFGCPVPKVVKKGAGSAALKDLVGTASLLRAIKNKIQIPLTIKIRTGWDAQSINAIDVVKMAAEEGVTWVAIHGRTRSQGYSGKADWDFIKEVKSQSQIPIIGNGDLTSAPLAVERLVESQCDAVMIGRGCLKNPWIFQQCMQRKRASDANMPEMERDFLQVFQVLREHLERNLEPKKVLLQSKKLSAWFSAGYKGSAHFRKTVFQLSQAEELFGHIDSYFSQLNHLPQPDTSGEAFLMGGHG